MKNFSKFISDDGPSENKLIKGIEHAIELSYTNKNDVDILNGNHPKVGCVILDKKGNIISRSYTREKDKKHAEVIAIERLAGKLENAHTLITTLEPCSSRSLDKHGNELSCAKAILKTNIKQVIIGMLDPVPVVRGRGIYILQKHAHISGINVLFFPSEYMKIVVEDNYNYITNVTEQPPDYWKDKIVIDEFHMMYTLNDIHCKLLNIFGWLYDEWLRYSSQKGEQLEFGMWLYKFHYNDIEQKLGSDIKELIIDYRGIARAIPQGTPKSTSDFMKKIEIMKAVLEWFKWFKSQPFINRCIK